MAHSLQFSLAEALPAGSDMAARQAWKRPVPGARLPTSGFFATKSVSAVYLKHAYVEASGDALIATNASFISRRALGKTRQGLFSKIQHLGQVRGILSGRFESQLCPRLSCFLNSLPVRLLLWRSSL